MRQKTLAAPFAVPALNFSQEQPIGPFIAPQVAKSTHAEGPLRSEPLFRPPNFEDAIQQRELLINRSWWRFYQ
jgi:hypothetical protein